LGQSTEASGGLRKATQRRTPLRLLMIVTILIVILLASLSQLPLVAYEASFLGLLGTWIVGLWLVRRRRYVLPQHPQAPDGGTGKRIVPPGNPAFSSQPTVAPTGLRRALLKHPLFSYFFLAYAIKYILLIPVTLAAWGVISGDWSPAFVLATFGPFAAGITMIYLLQGKAGVSRLRGPLRQWRVGWKMLLFILAGIPALVMLGIIIQPGALAGFLGFSPVLLVSYPITYVAVWFGGGGLNEEVGWRGFALPRMQSRYGPLWTALLLGIVHCFWHFEEFLTPAQGGGPGTGWTPFITNLPIFLLLVLSVTVIINWVFNRTRGSLFAAISAHASVDIPQAVLIPLFPAVGATSLLLGSTIGLGAVALLIVILSRGRIGYQPNLEAAPRPADIKAQPIAH
jgi:CAAX protease family protein